MTSEGGPRFGLDVPAFEGAYLGWYVDSTDSIRLRARQRQNGRLKGPAIYGDTLDELAGIIDRMEGTESD